MSELTDQTTRISWWRRLRRIMLSRAAIQASWIVNALMLLGTLLWILRDGKFTEAALQFTRHIRAIGNDESALAVVTPLMWPRVDVLWIVVLLGGLSTVGILAGLVAGSGQHRNVRSWLAVMLLLAGWLTLFTTWPEIAWRGQAWRVRGAVPAFEKLANELLADWPNSDGEIAGFGPFMAYPIGNPRTLMFMATPGVANTNLAISAIERGGSDKLQFELAENESMIARGGENDLHFQLAGNEEGVWLVRLEGMSEPQSFFSGLEGEYMPIKYRRLKPGWFIVRYIYAPIVPSEGMRISIPRR